MAAQTISNEQLWAMYSAGIAKAAGFANVPDGFILCGTSLIANLAVASKALPATAVPNMEEALFQVYNIANAGVALQGIYSPTQHNFFNDYASYINNLVPSGSQQVPTETQAGQIRLFQSEQADANNKYNSDLNSANAAWKQTESQYPTFDSFLNNTNWGAILNEDNTNITNINSQIQDLQTTIYGVEYMAIQTDKTIINGVLSAMQGSVANGPYDMAVQALSGTLVVPTYIPSDLIVFSSWVDSVITKHGNINGLPMTIININSDTAENDIMPSPFFMQTNGDLNNFFYTALNSNSDSSSQINIDTSDPDFSLEFQFDDITQVSLTKGPWFNSALTTTPYVYPNPGNLALPFNLIIGMYPQVKMTLGAACYTNAYSAYNTAGGFGLGNIWVSESNKDEAAIQTFTASWDNTTNKVTLQSLSINPIIIAMEANIIP